jgi:hypothetical protein
MGLVNGLKLFNCNKTIIQQSLKVERNLEPLEFKTEVSQYIKYIKFYFLKLTSKLFGENP